LQKKLFGQELCCNLFVMLAR